MVDLDRIPPKVAAFVDAVNAQDIAGIVECFHPDARLTSVPYYGEGLETVRYWANCLVNGQMTIRNYFYVCGSHNLNLWLEFHPPGKVRATRVMYCFELADDGRIAVLHSNALTISLEIDDRFSSMFSPRCDRGKQHS